MKKLATQKKIWFIAALFLVFVNKSNAQFTTPTIDATFDGAATYPNSYTSGATDWYMTWDNNNLYVFLQDANETEAVTIYLDVDPIVPVNGGTDADGTLIGLNYDNYTTPPNLPFRADICIYAHNNYREIFRRDGSNGWTSLGGGTDGICGGGTNDYTGNANGQYSSDNNGNGAGGDDRREFGISWARLLGTINSGARPGSFNWMGYVAYNNGMYAQVPVENYNGGAVSSNPDGIVRYFTVLSTANGSSTNPFSLNSYTQPLALSTSNFGAISVWDFTMNSSSQTITRANSGVWNIAGSLVIADGTISFGASSDVANVHNLEMSGGTLTLSSNIGGDLNISGNFNKTGGTFNCNNRQVNFNGTTAQSFNSSTSENINYFLNSNTSATLTLNSDINISAASNTAVLNANSTTVIATGAMLNLGVTTATLTANNTGSLLTVNGTLRSRGVVNGTTSTLIISATGTYEHNWTTAIGVIPTATWSTGSTCSIIGYNPAGNLNAVGSSGFNQSFSNFVWNCPNQNSRTISLASYLTDVSGNFSVEATGTSGILLLSSVTNSIINVGGNFAMNGGNFYMVNSNINTTLNISNNLNVNGGVFVVSSSTGNVQANVANYIQNGGVFNINTATGNASFLNITGNMTLNSGTLSKTVNGANGGNVVFNGSTNQSVYIDNPSYVTGTVNFRLNNAAGITLNNCILPINSAARFFLINGAVSLSGSAAIEYNPVNSFLVYNTAFDVTTSDVEWPNTNGPANVNISNSVLSNTSLNANKTIPGILAISPNNRLILGDYNLNITNTAAAAITGTFSPTCMVVAEGNGKLIRSVTTSTAYTWPIGDMTGTIEYSPVTMTFTASSISRDIGYSVVNAVHSQMNNPDSQNHYRGRYFRVYNSAGGTYTYYMTLYFVAADNVGTFANTKLNSYNGVSWSQVPLTNINSATTLGVNAAGAVNETNFPLITNNELTGRSIPQVYVWNENSGGTQSWAVASNWTPARNVLSFDDVLMFSNGGTSTANNIPTESIGKLIMANNTAVNLVPLGPSGNKTLSITGGNGTDLEVPAGCQLRIGDTPAANGLIIAFPVNPSTSSAEINGTLIINNNSTGNGLSFNNTLSNVNGTLDMLNGTFSASSNTTTTINGIFNNNNGTITSAAANLFFGGGSNYNHLRNGSVVPTATWDVASNCNIMGITATSPTGLVQNFGNFNWNCTGQTANIILGANVLRFVLGNLSFLSSNNYVVIISSSASTLNVGGNLVIDVNTGSVRPISANALYTLNVEGDVIINSGSVLHNQAGVFNFNLSKDFYLNGGVVQRTSGTFNCNFVNPNPSGIQYFDQSLGAFSGNINFNVGNGTTTNILTFSSNIDLGTGASPFMVNANATLDCSTYTLSNSTAAFTLSAGSTLITAHTDGIESTGSVGSIQTGSTRNFNAGADYKYNGTVLQNTGAGLTTANNLTIDNNAGVTLSSNTTVTGTVIFNNGKLLLSTFDLIASNNIASPFSGLSSSRYVYTNSTGQLKRSISTSGLPINYLFPVGDATNYSPVSLNFSANSTNRDIGVSVAQGAVPNNLPSPHYINRSWTFSNSASGTYSYNPTFTYVLADVVGTETNMKISRYVGPLWTQYDGTPNTTVTSPTMTLTGNLNETSGPLSSYWTGRVYNPMVNYTWNGSVSNAWNNASNWTPNGIPDVIDNVTISTSTPNPCVVNGIVAKANNFTLNGTGNLQLIGNAQLTINGNLNYVNTASASFSCNSTLYITSPNPQTIPALNYGNLDLTGGNRTLANGGTVGICGLLTPGAGVITVTNNTVNYYATGSQTIVPMIYNNLTISQNRGGGTITLPVGTITVNNTFSATLSNYTSSLDGNTFHFNGANGQVIPAFNYFNITSADFTRTFANSGIIDVKGTFSPAATKVNTITGSTVRYSSVTGTINLVSFATNVLNRDYNNIIFDGVGGTWNVGAANLRTTGTLVVNNGTVNVATSANSTLIVSGTTTINGGVIHLTSSTGTCTATFTGAVTVNNGQISISNGVTSGVGTATINNNLVINNGVFAVANKTSNGFVTVNGNITLNGGQLKMNGSGGQADMRMSGNNRTLSLNGGNLSQGITTANFYFQYTSFGQTQNISQGTATITGNTTFSFAGTTTLTVLHVNSNLTLGGNSTLWVLSGYTVNLKNNVIYGTGRFIVNNGGRVRTEHLDGFTLAPSATGCVQTNTRIFYGSALWWFEGAGLQHTGNAFPASVDRLEVNNGAGLVLDVSVRVQNTLVQQNNNHIYLGNNNLIIQAGASFSGNANKMIVTDGTGMLIRLITGTGNISYPIGDNTGTLDYSPVNFQFTTSGTDSVGFRVTNAQHPNDFSTLNYLNRYWSCNQIGRTTYSYIASFQYVDADIVGLESSLKVDRWSNPFSSWTQDAGSSVNVSSNTLTTSTLNQTNGTLLNNDFAGRSNAPFFYQSVTTGNWSNPSTWEISTDPLFISPPPIPAAVAPNTTNSVGVFIRNTHNVTVSASADANHVEIDAGGTLTINASQTFTLNNGSGTDMEVNGNLVNKGILTNNGTIEFNNLSVYSHDQNGGAVPTSTWNSGSLCEIIGVTNTGPTGLNQSFYDFRWNCTAQSSAIQLNGLLTNITNDFEIVNTGSPSYNLRLFDNTQTGTLSVGNNLNITGGTLSLINSASSGSGIATLNINGNLTLSAGGIDMTGSSVFTASGTNINLNGNLSISGTATIYRTQNVPAIFTFSKLSGLQTLATTASGINTSEITWRIGNASTTNEVVLNSNVVIGTTASFNVMNNATLTCANYVISGGNFETFASATLKIGSPDGITTSPTAAGNVQTTSRTFSGAANYTYNGTTHQGTGTALPTTITGNLTIDNPGNSVLLTNNLTTGSHLILNDGLFSIGTGQQFNISNTGIVDAVAGDFTNGTAGGTLNFVGAGSFTGNSNPYNVFISGSVNFGTGLVTIQTNGSLKINSGGSVVNNAPAYGSNSTLQYNVNSSYNRNIEWNSNSGKGYPYHVILSNNSTLNAPGLSGALSATVFNTAGNIDIETGSALLMSSGGNDMTVPLIINGNLTLTGNLTASASVGGDIELAGHWTNNGPNVLNFTHNSRTVTFNGTTLQNISGTNLFNNPFYNVTINNSNNVSLTTYDITVLNNFTLTSGKFDLSSNNLTVGTVGSNGNIVGGSSSSYIISGNASSNINKYTTTNSTTYNFPIGDATNYSPFSIQFYSSPMASNTYLSVNVINLPHPQRGTASSYITRYWQVVPSNLPNSTTDYSVQFQYVDGDVVGTESLLNPFKYDASGWIAAQGSGAVFEMGTGIVNVGTNTVTWSGINTFSDFTTIGNGTPLPISLLSFEAHTIIDVVELKWTTATEINNDYFTLEKSKDGKNFVPFAQIKGAGNSNTTINYSNIDNEPYLGVSYYRLKQTDFDGRYSYSQIVSVNFSNNSWSNNQVLVYPNPVSLNNNDGIYVVLPNTMDLHPINVQILDITGKIVYYGQFDYVNINTPIFVKFKSDDFANGVYALRILQNNTLINTTKLSIIK
ncbi:MAG: hypothetical protein IT238_05580 [Bacteroidia bacterium]|nr:hypothetical protein [Bacteroidia bacterium]MCZ2249723.1 hypothetical protein [Bacteroidia bacterium]